MNLTRPARKPAQNSKKAAPAKQQPTNQRRDPLKPHPSHAYEALTDENGNPVPEDDSSS